MSEKWNQRYRQATDLPAVNPWLIRYSHLLPQEGTALDLACGLGQNSFFLAKQGLSVEGWDNSKIGIEKLQQYADEHSLKVVGHCIDATEPWPESQFDVVYVSFFLDREVCPQIVNSLKPGGLLIYQTFNQVPLDSKPSNPNFLLQEGELPSLFSELRPLIYIDEGEHYELGNANSMPGKAILIAKKIPASA